MNFLKFVFLCTLGCISINLGSAEVKEADASNATAVSEVRPSYHSIPFLPGTDFLLLYFNQESIVFLLKNFGSHDQKFFKRSQFRLNFWFSNTTYLKFA